MSKARSNQALKNAIGVEPDLVGQASRVDLMHAFNWYNYNHEIRDTKKWIIDWMTNAGYSKTKISKYKSSNSTKIRQTYASIARLLTRGLEENSLEDNLRKHIDDVVDSVVPNIKRIVKLKPINNLLCQLDELLDLFYRSNYKKVPLIPEDFGNGYSSPQIKEVVTHSSELRQEIDTEQEGNNLTKPQQKRYIKFLDLVIGKLTASAVTVRRTRKPRAKKLVTADKIIDKLKYLKEDKLAVSVDPKKILQSSTLYAYDAKKRKLTKFVAKDKFLSIRGTTVVDFDPKKSYTKTVRSPADLVPLVLTEPKVRLAKYVEGLSTKSSASSGRINDQTILLRVFK